MSVARIVLTTAAVLLATTLASCGKQEEVKVEKAVAEVKKDAVAEAKAAEDAAKELD